MIDVPYYTKDGEAAEPLKFDETVFGAKVRGRLLREAVLMYEANRRVGTACTKTRAQVSGTGKKPFRQKGTGRARQGTRRAPHHRGGGVAWGPKPRDFSYAMPARARREALKSALLTKFKDGQTKVIEGISCDAPKTSKVAELLRKMSISRSCLVGVKGHDQNVIKSFRNIRGVALDDVRNFNAHEVLKNDTLLLTREALDALTAQAKAQE
jgi:large subunit ribosomal protein L4